MSTKFRCRYLTENYASDERVRRLVDTTDIFLVPSLNPDGYEEEDRCRGGQYLHDWLTWPTSGTTPTWRTSTGHFLAGETQRCRGV